MTAFHICHIPRKSSGFDQKRSNKPFSQPNNNLMSNCNKSMGQLTLQKSKSRYKANKQHVTSPKQLGFQSKQSKKQLFFEELSLKGRVQCFSMQVVTNKCFLLNPKKIGTILSSLRDPQNRLTPTHSNFEKMMSPSRRLKG